MKITQGWVEDFTKSMKDVEQVIESTDERLSFVETDKSTLLGLIKELRDLVNCLAKAQYDIMYLIYRKEGEKYNGRE